VTDGGTLAVRERIDSFEEARENKWVISRVSSDKEDETDEEDEEEEEDGEEDEEENDGRPWVPPDLCRRRTITDHIGYDSLRLTSPTVGGLRYLFVAHVVGSFRGCHPARPSVHHHSHIHWQIHGKNE
jgi:hypothetical protein